MVRTQVQLTPDQCRRLKRWAQQRSISLSEAVRRCVDKHLAAEHGSPATVTLLREALQGTGIVQDPEGDTEVAREHDQHLSGAFRA